MKDIVKIVGCVVIVVNIFNLCSDWTASRDVMNICECLNMYKIFVAITLYMIYLFIAIFVKSSLISNVEKNQVNSTDSVNNVCNLKPFYLRPMNSQHVVVSFNWRLSLATLSFRRCNNR